MLQPVEDFCRLVLFRHPELNPDFASRAVGDGDATLGRRGQASVVEWLKLLERLPVELVAASEQRQCQDPAAAIAAVKGLTVATDARLRDQHLGQWQGHRWDELAKEEPDRVREFFGEFGEVPAPGGESLGEAVERMLDWWGDTRDELVGKTCAVVASGAMVTGFAAAMLGMRLSRAVCLQLPHAGVGVLDVYENGARMATWNPTAFGA